jgi:hypothetical protein
MERSERRRDSRALSGSADAKRAAFVRLSSARSARAAMRAAVAPARKRERSVGDEGAVRREQKKMKIKIGWRYYLESTSRVTCSQWARDPMMVAASALTSNASVVSNGILKSRISLKSKGQDGIR